MAGNSIGQILRLSTFGESHGPAIGGILEGFPPGISIDFDEIQKELDRRRPGQSAITTDRKESDRVEFLSGFRKNQSLGTPIGFVIRNEDSRPADYENINKAFRPSHADFTYFKKYGFHPEGGGGRASARETVCRVVGGALARQLLTSAGIQINAYVVAVGPITLASDFNSFDPSVAESNNVRCPDPSIAERMEDYIKDLKKAGDSTGGIIHCIVKGCPAGLGEPVFSKLHAELGKAMLSINAVKGIEFGSGFHGTTMKGSEHNDHFTASESQQISTVTNRSGGIQGGISNGEDIYFRVAFKPTSTIKLPQETVNMIGENTILEGKGRHDPCVVPRAIPVVEAMTALILADFTLLQKTLS